MEIYNIVEAKTTTDANLQARAITLHLDKASSRNLFDK